MRMLIPALTCSIVLLASPSLGQEIGGDAPPSSVFTQENCVEVEIGDAKAYDCLNGKLRRQAQRVSPLFNMPPIDSKSSDIHLGIANMPAVRQQYGQNYGKSVIPYRPAPPVYSAPLR